MKHLHKYLASGVKAVRNIAAALALTAMATSASAALFSFHGQIDDAGPLDGSSFTGSFAYDDPVGADEVSAALSEFTLTLLGQTYTLASPNAFGVAWLTGGVFDGFNFTSYDDWDAPSFSIDLHSGFPEDPLVGQFGFLANPVDGKSLGTFTVIASSVPEPGMLALLLAAGGAAAWVARQRRRV